MFANFKAKLIKVDLRKAGKKVIVLETSSRLSAGELEAINDMIDQDVAIGMDSQVVSYRIRKDARTDEPLITYKVTDYGEVQEIQLGGAQAELELGLPPEKQKIKEETAEISREIVEEFILSGLAPRYEDLEYDFVEITQRHADGESYLRIASELELSSGKLAELLDEYGKRIAPLAAKWDEWRQSRMKAVEDVIAHTTMQHDSGTDTEEVAGTEEQAAPDEGKQGDVQETDPEDIEGYILKNNPTFDEFQFDFPEILKRKLNGESWIQIAQSLKTPSTTLQAAWGKYKKKVKEAMKGQDGAA